VIVLAVRWYLRFGLSYRDLEELLAERGVEVDHVTLFGWVQRFTPRLIEAARPCRHAVGDRWFVDQTYVKVAGRWRYVYRAVDHHGQVIDVLVSPRRHTAAARRFFRRALSDHREPAEVLTDQAPALRGAIDELAPAGVSQHRPVRQQPGRSRPRPIEGATPPDARAQTPPHCHSDHPRTGLHPEPATASLRTRYPSPARAPPCSSVR